MITTLITHDKAEIQDLSEQDLIEQLNIFFIANEKKAYAIAVMSLKNKDDALDVVQDVMIKFVEKYKRKNQKHWCSLFYRMVQNRITDFHRSNTKKRKYFSFFNTDKDENIIEQVADENYVTALQQMDDYTKIENLQDCLNELPTRQLQAFVCRIWEGLSVKETANSMKCSQGSVKTHLFRALKSIREQMKQIDSKEPNRPSQMERSHEQ